MRRRCVLLAAVSATAMLRAGAAPAACTFDLAPARGIKASMVRTYAACPSTDHPVGNTETEGGTVACTPVAPPEVVGIGTTYQYGPKGSCTVSASVKMLTDCSAVAGSDGTPLGLDANACHVMFVASKCKDLRSLGGNPIEAADGGWMLAALTRATLADAFGGDMTVIDFPVTFAYSTPADGKMSLKSSSAEALAPLIGVHNADLPPCTQIEIVDLRIKDPDGLPFAVIGGATTP